MQENKFGAEQGVTVGRKGREGEQKGTPMCNHNKVKNRHEIDKEAFIMVTTIHEVLGEGFKQIENKKQEE